jgi:hypothetical protein
MTKKAQAASISMMKDNETAIVFLEDKKFVNKLAISKDNNLRMTKELIMTVPGDVDAMDIKDMHVTD